MGAIPADMPETFVTMVLMSGFMSYFVYLLQELETKEVPKERTKEIFTEKYFAGFWKQRNTEIRKRESCGKRDSLSFGMKIFIFYRQTRVGRLCLWEPQQFPE